MLWLLVGMIEQAFYVLACSDTIGYVLALRSRRFGRRKNRPPEAGSLRLTPQPVLRHVLRGRRAVGRAELALGREAWNWLKLCG